ncbi:hypothetical protein [Gordonia alkaliphila]|uniref:ATPase BadF/BadG/BcrA/BcrD type domain-containing protein n=1 Tax=Gordonia alkaliphila TaxID=1053547 RepID=A0ABP8Z2T4_9ACTN
MLDRGLTGVVVDSGGTSTRWGFLYSDGSTELLATRSYHPRNFDDEFFVESDRFLKAHLDRPVPIFFFGAGLGGGKGRDCLQEFLGEYFSTVMVESDIEGIAQSLRKRDGAVAIMGTGSVLVLVEDGAVSRMVGGLGPQRGDEGSAYFFGSMVLADFHDGKLSAEQAAMLARVMPGPVQSAPEDVAGLAADLDPILFEEFHVANIKEFFRVHVDEEMCGSEITFIGSYAYFQSREVRAVAEMHGLHVVEFIRDPIDHLCRHFGTCSGLDSA